MTRSDIIRMAREAGLHRQQHNLMSNPAQYRFSYEGYEENLERFTALVAADQREAWEDALKDAFFEGFTSVATYNDTILNSPEEAWEKYKPSRAKTNQ